MTLRNAFENLSTEAKQDSIVSALQSILTELATKVDEGGTVTLSPASLNALEQITVGGEVSLSSASLNALENVSVSIEAGSGLASETKQDSAIGKLDDILTNLVTAAAQAATTAAVEQFADLYSRERRLSENVRVLPYAKDTTDRMRTIIENSPTVNTIGILGSSTSSTSMPGWYSNFGAGVGAMDPREQQREFSHQTFNQVRNQRWEIS